jgi:hypothetical protein
MVTINTADRGSVASASSLRYQEKGYQLGRKFGTNRAYEGEHENRLEQNFWMTNKC